MTSVPAPHEGMMGRRVLDCYLLNNLIADTAVAAGDEDEGFGCGMIVSF